MRVQQLDGLRVIMFIPIFLGHFQEIYGYTNELEFLHLSSGLSLQFFFLLSGIGLYLNCYEIRFPKKNIYEMLLFASNKIRKIYFVYIFSLLLYIPILSSFDDVKVYVVKFLINITLLQGLFPSVSVSHGINGVAWFLSSLFIAYLLVPVFLRYMRRFSNNSMLIGVSLGLILLQSVVASEIRGMGISFEVLGKSIAIDIGSTAYQSIPVIFLGMIIGRMYTENKANIVSGGGNSIYDTNNCLLLE